MEDLNVTQFSEITDTNPTRIKLINIPEVCEILGVKKSWLYESMKKDAAFPKRVKIGGSTRFIEQEIMDWIKSRIDQRNKA
jgi:predicted DNA-binding transcriptional regulator AlpA